MAIELLPEWMTGLEEEDVAFIKKFILASGSLIQKIKLTEDTAADPYIAVIKRLAMNEKLDLDTAKVLIAEYKKTRNMKEEL